MNQLDTQKRVAILSALVEGNSIRATCRTVRVSKNTVARLLADVGAACADYLNETVCNLRPARVQCDEIWSFCSAKDKNVPAELRGVYGYGDVWTWTAIDPDTKLVMTYRVGLRTAEDARAFMQDLAGRILNLTQLSTDGFAAYPDAVHDAFGTGIDYAQIIKSYGLDPAEGARRYSPSICPGAAKRHVMGCPEPNHICTSHIERQDLTMRMSMRRFTRLTNVAGDRGGHAFSKKVENLEHAVALHFMHYNFCRIHETIRCTPAMAAGLTTKLWSLADIISAFG